MFNELTKDGIRQKIWQFLEENDIADYPRPVFGRIPNFKGSIEACHKASGLECFQNAKIVKICPDKPQQHIRLLTLEANKTLLTSVPRLKYGFLNEIIIPKEYHKEDLKNCVTSKGMKKFAIPRDIEDKIKIDLIICGAVAVSTQGRRIGKGEGFADLGYGILTNFELVTEDTSIVSIVHDCQIFDQLQSHLFKPHDITLDYIVSPNRVIKCEPRLPRPYGINWSMLTKDKLNSIPILRKLWHQENKTRNVFVAYDNNYKLNSQIFFGDAKK